MTKSREFETRQRLTKLMRELDKQQREDEAAIEQAYRESNAFIGIIPSLALRAARYRSVVTNVVAGLPRFVYLAPPNLFTTDLASTVLPRTIHLVPTHARDMKLTCWYKAPDAVQIRLGGDITSGDWFVRNDHSPHVFTCGGKPAFTFFSGQEANAVRSAMVSYIMEKEHILLTPEMAIEGIRKDARAAPSVDF
jgi:hypothetical protein